MRRVLRLLPMLCIVPGCAGGGRAAADPPPVRVPAGGWRGIVTDADRARLRGWRETWVTALGRATAAGFGGRIQAEGALLRPDAALPSPVPPAGSYRCRITKLGARASGSTDYTAYPAFSCRISGNPSEPLAFVKLDGSQRPVGRLYPQDANRMIFLGTMTLGDERRALPYGRDPERDMVGFIERIGPRRWRLVLPAPRWESLLDVMELVPA